MITASITIERPTPGPYEVDDPYVDAHGSLGPAGRQSSLGPAGRQSVADGLSGNADGDTSQNPGESRGCSERSSSDSARPVVGIDFFAGCGGTSLGFSQAGIRPVLAIDNDSEAAATYRANFPDAEYIESDIELQPDVFFVGAGIDATGHLVSFWNAIETTKATRMCTGA